MQRCPQPGDGIWIVRSGRRSTFTLRHGLLLVIAQQLYSHTQ